MANLIKEEERNERMIRGLLKLPENRRCINCNSLGPQYVCANFWTFVCTTCSGIHREFSHRVKSVSMAKFTSQEVNALREGGNQRAKEIYLKEWDSQRNTLPDGSNVDRLRDFIKHVYVDGRFSGEKTSDRPPRGKMGDKEDSFQGPQSPPYEENYERRFSDRSSSGGRSPGYDQGSYQKSPTHPGVVNDWRREDRLNDGRKNDERRTPDGESRVGGSPEHTKDVETSSPPLVRPVRKILGENVLPLRIIEPPKSSSGARISNGSVQTQRTASSSSLGSANGREPKPENPPASLIDFDADPEPPPPPAAAAPPLARASVSTQGVQPTVASTSDNNWASFDAVPLTEITQPPLPVVNSLDSVLFQLTGPSGGKSGVSPSVSGTTIPPVASVPGFPPNTSVPTVHPVNDVSMLPQGGLTTASQGAVPTLPIRSGNSSGMQPQQSDLFPSQAVPGTTFQPTLPFGGASASQTWNAPVASNSLAPQNRVPSQVFNSGSYSTTGINPGAQNPPVEVKNNSRKELPMDLFTATYPSFPAPMMGWQAGMPYTMGYMQYHPVMSVPTLFPQSKTVNPFGVNDPSPVQVPTFPSMASLQGALPTMQPAFGAPRPSNMGTPTTSWGSAQPPAYMPAMPSQVPDFASALPHGVYVGQQVMGSNPPSRYPGAGTFGNEGAAFASVLGSNPLVNSPFPAPYNQRSSAPAGGNPFG